VRMSSIKPLLSFSCCSSAVRCLVIWEGILLQQISTTSNGACKAAAEDGRSGVQVVGDMLFAPHRKVRENSNLSINLACKFDESKWESGSLAFLTLKSC
jgi:hypothetical protein